mmetsp:Transcript_16551/g.49014  ORF Transcript_16551/g.49014 Transcript_16551/m.49014 type:complete len:258 (-) Transcript_16551:130-903(-)
MGEGPGRLLRYGADAVGRVPHRARPAASACARARLRHCACVPARPRHRDGRGRDRAEGHRRGGGPLPLWRAPCSGQHALRGRRRLHAKRDGRCARLGLAAVRCHPERPLRRRQPDGAPRRGPAARPEGGLAAAGDRSPRAQHRRLPHRPARAAGEGRRRDAPLRLPARRRVRRPRPARRRRRQQPARQPALPRVRHGGREAAGDAAGRGRPARVELLPARTLQGLGAARARSCRRRRGGRRSRRGQRRRRRAAGVAA